MKVHYVTPPHTKQRRRRSGQQKRKNNCTEHPLKRASNLVKQDVLPKGKQLLVLFSEFGSTVLGRKTQEGWKRSSFFKNFLITWWNKKERGSRNTPSSRFWTLSIRLLQHIFCHTGSVTIHWSYCSNRAYISGT
jgi:hypothetical protein